MILYILSIVNYTPTSLRLHKSSIVLVLQSINCKFILQKMYTKLIVTIVFKNKTNNGESAGQKRHAPITFSDDSGNKHGRTDARPRELYHPPSGKYSKNVSSYGK